MRIGFELELEDISENKSRCEARTMDMGEQTRCIKAAGHPHDHPHTDGCITWYTCQGCGREWNDTHGKTECPSCSEKREPPEMRPGLYGKFKVERRYDPDHKHQDCEYFVLDLVHDKFAAVALRAYAKACRKEFPQLSVDLMYKSLELANKFNLCLSCLVNEATPSSTFAQCTGCEKKGS